MDTMIKKNRMYTEDLSHIETIHIPHSKLKDGVRKGIKAEGLYFLESIFGECDGHGCGFGGEDISFTIKKNSKYNRKPYHLRVEITDDGKKMEIGETVEMFTHKNKRDALEAEPCHVSPELVKIIKRTLIKK